LLLKHPVQVRIGSGAGKTRGGPDRPLLLDVHEGHRPGVFQLFQRGHVRRCDAAASDETYSDGHGSSSLCS